MRFIEKTGKTVDEAVQSALNELKVLKEQVNVEVIEESGKKFFGLFGNKLAKVRVSVIQEMREVAGKIDSLADELEESVHAKAVQIKEDLVEKTSALEHSVMPKDTMDNKLSVDEAVEVAKEFLENVFKSMSLAVVMEKFVSTDGVVTFNLHGKQLGILIGKHGQTLDSLQYLTNLVANKNSGQRIKIVLDIENYRNRRVDTLTVLAKRLAGKVKRSGERVVLEPMNPHERKVIHIALQDDRRILTYSEGEEPHRYVVIELKK